MYRILKLKNPGTRKSTVYRFKRSLGHPLSFLRLSSNAFSEFELVGRCCDNNRGGQRALVEIYFSSGAASREILDSELFLLRELRDFSGCGQCQRKLTGCSHRLRKRGSEEQSSFVHYLIAKSLSFP